MYTVYFENSRKVRREIGAASTEQDAYKIIMDFLKGYNYPCYYTRSWLTENEEMCVDVGSWSEFFYIKMTED